MGLGAAATAAIIASSASAAVSAYSSYEQGKAAQRQGKNEQILANANAANQEVAAQNDEMRANEELKLSSFEARQHLKDAKKFEATQRNALLSNGAILEEGSPLLIMQESAEQTHREQNSILREGYVRSTDFKYRSYMDRFNSKITRQGGVMAKSRGNSAQQASYMQAGSSLLSGAANAYMIAK